jgi:hypothetical protein
MAPHRKPLRRLLAKRGRIGLNVAQAHGPVRRREMAKHRQARGAGEASVPPVPSSSERERLEAAVASLSGLNADQLRLQWRNHLRGIAPPIFRGGSSRACSPIASRPRHSEISIGRSCAACAR